MAETVNGRKVFSLFEVTKSIQKTLDDRYKTSFWVKAEMNKLNHYKKSGHCYPELVERKNGIVVAELKAHIWKNDYRRIESQFLKVLKESLKDGIKIMFLAQISYEPEHGLGLHILDIDPSYTLGDLEMEKRTTISRLRLENLFNKNKLLQLPVLPQRIAIISVETSKGYADFMEVLLKNSWDYNYFTMLFPSILQGDRAAAEIIVQLKKIARVSKHFDAVAIIRGGGGDVGLACYNNYNLAQTICEFPIPVLTGIGHSTNETVCEMVSHTNAITPTKLGEHLIQNFHNFSVPVKEAQKLLIDKSRRILLEAKTSLKAELKLLHSLIDDDLLRLKTGIKNLVNTLDDQVIFLLNKENYLIGQEITTIKAHTMNTIQSVMHHLDMNILSLLRNATTKTTQNKQLLQQSRNQLLFYAPSMLARMRTDIGHFDSTLKYLHPYHILQRGYSITYLNNKPIRQIEQIKEGDEIKTVLSSGSFTSIVKSKNN
jgi:exodeoxyribonuclease VII large subunit